MKVPNKVFYLSGGMSNLSYEESNTWRSEIEKYFSEQYHINIFNPNNHWNINSEDIDEKAIMEYDLFRLRTSDIVICGFNDKFSVGTNMELGMAYELRIPIIGLNMSGDNFDLHPWQVFMCTKMFSDINTLCEYVLKHYVYDD